MVESPRFRRYTGCWALIIAMYSEIIITNSTPMAVPMPELDPPVAGVIGVRWSGNPTHTAATRSGV